jgi:hypothetical protein
MAPDDSSRSAPSELGAYGLRLDGVELAGDLLVPAEPSWPRFRVGSSLGEATEPTEHVDADHARLRLRSGGEILLDRRGGTIEFRVPHELSANEIVHPYLAPAAAVIGRWFGRESFHAGAFVAGGAAWAILGEREAGKSSTLARLALSGHPVVCDDMLVLDGLNALAAPRSVDLRGDAARELGAGEFLGVVGARERWRLSLDGDPGSPPLAGWIFLAWGERVEVVPVPPAERLTRIVPHRGVRLPPTDPGLLLDLAALPGWELRRPPGWASLPAAVDALLQTVED